MINNYTKEKLRKKLSELICGHLYIYINKNIPKFVNMCKNFKNTYNLLSGMNLVLLDLMKLPIITDEFCQDHFGCSLADFNKLSIDTSRYKLKQLITDDDYQELTDYLKKILKQQIKEILENTHEQRNKYLLELNNDDKIGQFYGEIDYDPHTIQFRDAPVVVYKDFLDNKKDKVLIGKFGEAHIDCINREDKDVFNKSNGYVSECYFYAPCVFIDTTNGKYSIDEVAQILKNDSRIKKVYLSPGRRGGQLKRLAKRLF